MESLVAMMKVLVIEKSSKLRGDIKIALKIRWPKVEIQECMDSRLCLKFLKNMDRIRDIVVIGESSEGDDTKLIIRKIRSICDIPIIVVGLRIYDDIALVQALESGADEYIRAPFNQTEFISRVNAITRVKQGQYKAKQTNPHRNIT